MFYLQTLMYLITAAKNANQIAGLVRRSFAFLDTKSFPLLFRLLVCPHLEYGNSVWAPRLMCDKQLIEGLETGLEERENEF